LRALNLLCIDIPYTFSGSVYVNKLLTPVQMQKRKEWRSNQHQSAVGASMQSSLGKPAVKDKVQHEVESNPQQEEEGETQHSSGDKSPDTSA
jgi:hypothetical protein